jgi:hypothetical protein
MEQVEPPECDEDQRAGRQAKQQHNRFQHDRIISAGTRESCARIGILSSDIFNQRPDETFFLNRRNHPETKGQLSSLTTKRGWPKCDSSLI